LVLKVADVARARGELLSMGVEMYPLVAEDSVRRCDGLDCEGHRFQLTQ
jgi:hypothetical protein